MGNKKRAIAVLTAFFVICSGSGAMAEEKPAREEKSDYGWYTDLKTGKRYFYDRNGELHYGWLRHQGSWYYFTALGNMIDAGYRTIDNENYFFYNTGKMAAGTYLGLHYINENGHREEKYDIRLIGSGEVTMYDRDMISDAVYFVPSKWIMKFVKDGWQMMYYTRKPYLEAPDTDLGVYYMNYKLDTTYKKLKFTVPEEITRGMGEYIGYCLGLYEEGNVQMAAMWSDEMAVAELEEIPDYYEDDPGFYFGILCRLFWDPETTKDLEEAAPDTYSILKELIQ